jgi:hypothetical protein
MALSWNEIKDRAIHFSKEWENDFNEDAEAKSFMDAFFNVFGVPRRRVASFEINIKKDDGRQGFIDLLWKGVILIEFKSKGKDLDKAHSQAKGYFPGLKDSELPRYILVCDFVRFRLYDLEEDVSAEFRLSELVKNVKHFNFILGYPKQIYKEQTQANIIAAELMGKLHDRLKEIGYTGHRLEVYLVRILFCLFAEDTTIFDKQQFQNYIEQRTNEDGSDLAAKLQELFQVLDTVKESRFKNIDEHLSAFVYVNGRLFEETLPMASFDSKMRQALLDCCAFEWSKISPAIFGSMFQSVMNPKERRDLGAHYTSETNILKVIKPLFLDELWKEFESIKDNKNKLSGFHKKISELKFLDPACGCGNFLVITYRELRLLELEILRKQYENQIATNIENIIWLDVDMMYGIEYEEFPARIAEVAMWLIDHQMNMQISNEFGQYFIRLPLKKAAKITHGNALTTNWQSLLNPINAYTVYAEHTNIIPLVNEPNIPYGTANVFTKTHSIKTKEEVEKEASNEIMFDYIIGNPPFSGSKKMSQIMRDDVVKCFGNVKSAGVLDYVAAWYIKAAKYIQHTKVKVAFVSTNSIVQGEQVSILWGQMLNKYDIKIHFAHRTFKWKNEAKGNAAVYCIIIGFANFDTKEKIIFDYEDIKGAAHEIKANNINPYLVDAKNIFIEKRRKPISKVPKILFGNMPNDDGNLLLSNDEKIAFIQREAAAEKFIKPMLSSKEYLNGLNRWCLWLREIQPNELTGLPEVLKRVQAVRIYRNKSTRQGTKKLADYPTLFGEIRQPETNFILIPRHSSENRKYIPIGFFDKNYIVSDSCSFIANASLYHFGILQSLMHLAWIKTTCGRIKSDFRYSNEIVYNNYPFPLQPTEKQIKSIEEKAQMVLDVRLKFTNSSLADLYDPNKMPPSLTKAHIELDKAVDLAYRSQPFTTDANRMEFLFELYEKYTADLFTKEKVKKRKKISTK